MTSDSWYGTVPGYEELRDFSLKMAKELDWLPGSMGMANPQMSEAAEEFKKNAIKVEGMPLLQYTSFGMAGNGQAASGDASQQPPPQQTSSDSAPTSATGAIAKGFGGLFGKKKKEKEQADSNAAGAPNGPPPPAPVAGSLMDMTIEVTSYSKDSLDSSLFDVPAGYAQVQPDMNAK
jgi:hypothetical protein